MRLALPDLVSPSYFPAIAAVDLGLMRENGLNIQLKTIFPVPKAVHELRDGEVDFVAGPAHAALSAFPKWGGAKLVCALSENTFWYLVVRADIPVERGQLTQLHDLRIGAAPGPDIGLRQLLESAGVDPEKARIDIGPVSRQKTSSSSFGLAAAEALEDGRVDAFWANGMGAEVAVRGGTGKIIVDSRRDGGEVAKFTFAALMTTDDIIAARPADVAAAVSAVTAAHARLRRSPALATSVGARLFPPAEANLIESLVVRDLPYYRSDITPSAVASLNAFSRRVGLLDGDPSYTDVVAASFAASWAVPESERGD